MRLHRRRCSPIVSRVESRRAVAHSAHRRVASTRRHQLAASHRRPRVGRRLACESKARQRTRQVVQRPARCALRRMPDELDHYPILPPTTRQRRMLRRAVFARVEDPKLSVIEKQGRLRMTLSQLMRNRRFKRGKGLAPQIGEGWSADVQLERVDAIKPSTYRRDRLVSSRSATQQHPIDDLITRYLRAQRPGRSLLGRELLRLEHDRGPAIAAVSTSPSSAGWRSCTPSVARQ